MLRTLLATAVAVLLLAPAAQARTYGATTLTLDPGTVAALTGLGVTPAPIAPATAVGTDLAFPITNGPFAALLSGTIKHGGGISLTAGATTVKLERFCSGTRPSGTACSERIS